MTSTSPRYTSTGSDQDVSADAIPAASSDAGRAAGGRRATGLAVPRRRRVVMFVSATAGTGIAALALGMWLGGNLTESQIDGLAVGGTGDLTGWGLPAAKLVLDLSSVGVIGLLLACLLLPGAARGAAGGDTAATARRCLRTATWLALAWAVANAALLLFSWSDVVAQPVTDLPLGKIFTDTAGTFPDAGGYITSTALALVIAAGVAVTETGRGAIVLLPLAIYNLVPMALEGHASHGTVLKYSIAVHVIAVSLWVGGLAALLVHVRGKPALLAVTVPRFSTIALACYTAIAATGIVAGWELLGSVPAVWGSRYGVVVMLKAGALVTLGIFGWWHRRRTVPPIRTDGGPRSRRAFVRLAAAEVAVMVAAVAIAVALSRSASPDTILLHSNRKAISAPAVRPGGPAAAAARP
ncbi:MAG TPA: CopD family protein [Streptosporangiaceae bacterium]